jgi:hypothetical protein
VQLQRLLAAQSVCFLHCYPPDAGSFHQLVVTKWTKGHVLHVSIAHGMQQHAAVEIDTSHDEQLE